MSRRVSLKHPIYTVFGANTGVGKTIVSTLLVKHLAPKVDYIKPVSTGPLSDADYAHVSRFVGDGVKTHYIHQFERPCSPHLAAAESTSQRVPSDASIQSSLSRLLETCHYTTLIESAGGVHSPSPSGTSQMSLYRPFRLPVILVADTQLGGISTTRSAYEVLTMNGYDVVAVVGLKSEWGNLPYLSGVLPVPIMTLPRVPERAQDPSEDEEHMAVYYDVVATSAPVAKLADTLQERHEARVQQLRDMPALAASNLWYPFTQHSHIKQDEITTIDSAYGDDFAVFQNDTLRPVFDGSASWWTQGLGHGNAELALTAAYAASRYGHVILPNAVNEPALALATRLLDTVGKGWANRVYYSDNGATAIEVALKMALKASRVRYGASKEELKLGLIGLVGSYHGDTIGAMDASEPNVYNEEVDWYDARGLFFQPPKVSMRKGLWCLDMPEEQDPKDSETFESLKEVFDLTKRKSSKTAKVYQEYITQRIASAVDRGQKFGALLFEPILMGAGGMIFVDPLFQHILTQIVRASNKLCPADTTQSWTGLPVITDEVFTGLYRLSHARTFDLLQMLPDISVNAKLLTGGVVPLSTTMASEAIFQTFLKSGKKDALLHGHSYTAHPIGTSIALQSLSILDAIHDAKAPVYSEEHRDVQEIVQESRSNWQDSPIHSIWKPEWITQLSHHAKIECVVCLGSVVAVTLVDQTGGYSSLIASALVSRLKQNGTATGEEADRGVMVRPLGNVVYVMASQFTTRDTADSVQSILVRCLED